jgi:LacI family transcriptional regulator
LAEYDDLHEPRPAVRAAAVLYGGIARGARGIAMTARPRAPRIGIRDVAAHAGVSVGSASRVVNGVANVASELRERVQAAIAELGYRPNHAARSLRMQASRTIGCMLTDVTNPLYGKVFHALEDRLRAAGYVVLLANSLNNAERELEILSTFAARGMDGVIIAPGNERDTAVLQAVRNLDMPAVILDRDMALDCDQVLYDHVSGMRAVTAHLVGLGHRHIALVVSRALGRPMRRRIEGFRSGLAALGLQADDGLIVELPSAMSSSFDTVSRLLARRPRPTALVVLGTNLLTDALNAIAVQGLRIPDDVSLVSLGDPDFARSYTPPITTLRVDVQQAAERVVTLLLDRVEQGERGPGRSVKVVPELIVRSSCAQPHADGATSVIGKRTRTAKA